MKRIVLILVILGAFTSVRAQEFDQNELRLNLLDMLSRGTLNASYERFLTPQTSLGVTTMVALNDDYTEKFEFAPSFRMYFNDDLLVLRKSVFVEVFTAFVVAETLEGECAKSLKITVSLFSAIFSNRLLAPLKLAIAS